MKKTAILILLLMSAVFARETPQLTYSFEFIPPSIYSGESTTGVFYITNPVGAKPVFDFNIAMWIPCRNENYSDFEPITQWTMNNPIWKDSRVVFSGVLAQRETTGTDLSGNLQNYSQCLYSFVFQLPSKADGFKGPAVIRPGETVNLNFTLQSTYSARTGVYFENLVSTGYVSPGKELAALIKE
jgi:hypothetical protein